MITKSWVTQVKIEAELQFRSSVVIFLVFAFLALSSVVTQYFLPDIIQLSGLDIVNLPEPSMQGAFEDVWGDFLFTGAIVVIFIGSASISQYFGADRPIYFLLSRPLSRNDYYYARSAVRGISLLAILQLTSILVYILGSILFDPIDFAIVVSSSLVLGLALTSFLFMLQMVNTRLETFPTVGVGIVVLVIMTLISLLSGYLDFLTWFSPFSLASIWPAILHDQDYSRFWINSLALVIWNAVPLYIGSLLFRNRDI